MPEARHEDAARAARRHHGARRYAQQRAHAEFALDGEPRGQTIGNQGSSSPSQSFQFQWYHVSAFLFKLHISGDDPVAASAGFKAACRPVPKGAYCWLTSGSCRQPMPTTAVARLDLARLQRLACNPAPAGQGCISNVREMRGQPSSAQTQWCDSGPETQAHRSSSRGPRRRPRPLRCTPAPARGPSAGCT